MNDEQKQAARERMAKARAVRMANLQARAQESPVASLDIPETGQPDLVLSIRRLHVGSFAGLWELARIEKDGTRVVISDANTKLLIINLARNEILKCGQ